MGTLPYATAAAEISLLMSTFSPVLEVSSTVGQLIVLPIGVVRPRATERTPPNAFNAFSYNLPIRNR